MADKTQIERMPPRMVHGGLVGFISAIIVNRLDAWGVEVGAVEVGYVTGGVAAVVGFVVSVLWPILRDRLLRLGSRG